jgi:hypothetical protein
MKMRKHLQKATEIKNGSAGFLNEINREARVLIAKTKTDTMLSAEGRQIKSKELRAKKGAEFMQALHARKNEYMGHLKKAQQAAKEVLKTPIKKASDEEIQDFQKSLKDLKTTIMLSTNPKTSEAKLQAFVAEIKHPYLASLLRDEFPSVVGDIISSAGSEAQQYKMRLFDVFESLEKDFLTDEYREAQGVVQFTESEIASNRLFMGFAPDGMPSLHMQSVIETFGNDIARYIDKTDQYFVDNEDAEKPADIEVSDFEEETGAEVLSIQQRIERAEKQAAGGSVEARIYLAHLKKELGVN